MFLSGIFWFFWFLITLYTEYTFVMYLALKQFNAIIFCHIIFWLFWLILATLDLYIWYLLLFLFLITLYTEYTLVMYLALKQFIAIISCHDSDVKHLSRSHKNSVPMWFDEILRCASPPPDGASELPIAAPPGHLAARHHGSCLPSCARERFSK